MNKTCLSIVLIIALLFSSCATSSVSFPPSPCDNPRFRELEKIEIKEMTEAEWDEYKFFKQLCEENKNSRMIAQSNEIGGKALEQIYGLQIGLIILAVIFGVLSTTKTETQNPK